MEPEHKQLIDRRDAIVARAAALGVVVRLPEGDPAGEEFRWEEALDHAEVVVSNNEPRTWEIIGAAGEVVGTFEGTWLQFNTHMEPLRAAVQGVPG